MGLRERDFVCNTFRTLQYIKALWCTLARARLCKLQTYSSDNSQINFMDVALFTNTNVNQSEAKSITSTSSKKGTGSRSIVRVLAFAVVPPRKFNARYSPPRRKGWMIW